MGRGDGVEISRRLASDNESTAGNSAQIPKASFAALGIINAAIVALMGACPRHSVNKSANL
jgi:hypothetical protein